MDATLYQINGKESKSIRLPAVFSGKCRVDLLRRALLAEQSRRYQPQAHALLAGLQTTATYVGRYDASWRRGRHMGTAIRPRQMLGGGAQGDVRRIPSSTKGRRAHPHKLEKRLEERINRKEYLKAIESAIAGCADVKLVNEYRRFNAKALPLVIEDRIETVAKTKELIGILSALGLESDLERSHDPSKRKGKRRLSRQRRFRKSVLIVVKDDNKVGKAGRNIPGVDVCSISSLTIEKLAPGAEPRITVWSEGAVNGVENEIKSAGKMVE